MVAVTTYSDFGAQKIKFLTVPIVSPSICLEVVGLDAMILVFCVEFLANFFTLLFQLHHEAL